MYVYTHIYRVSVLKIMVCVHKPDVDFGAQLGGGSSRGCKTPGSPRRRPTPTSSSTTPSNSSRYLSIYLSIYLSLYLSINQSIYLYEAIKLTQVPLGKRNISC